ncbi:hypothetical protein KP509_1Z045500 [Ceratopteris richardii]|nr:hypothetical protein KP509_1Z045500 [Ceratopteris richardii]
MASSVFMVLNPSIVDVNVCFNGVTCIWTSSLTIASSEVDAFVSHYIQRDISFLVRFTSLSSRKILRRPSVKKRNSIIRAGASPLSRVNTLLSDALKDLYRREHTVSDIKRAFSYSTAKIFECTVSEKNCLIELIDSVQYHFDGPLQSHCARAVRNSH